MKPSTSFGRTWALGIGLAIASANLSSAGCNSSSSASDAGTGIDDGPVEASGSSGGSSGAPDAPEDLGSGGDTGGSRSSSSSSSSSSSGASGSSGGDAGLDTSSSCDNSNMCIGKACCPGKAQTCPPFTLTAGTVTDSTTGLTWERDFADLSDYTSGVTTCASWGGRIPTQAELQNYLASRASCTAMGVSWAIPDSTACIWSSTASEGGGAHECVYTNAAQTNIALDGDAHYLLCVK